MPADSVDLSALDGKWKAESRGWRILLDIKDGEFELRSSCGKGIMHPVFGRLDPTGRIIGEAKLGSAAGRFWFDGTLDNFPVEGSSLFGCVEHTMSFERVDG